MRDVESHEVYYEDNFFHQLLADMRGARGVVLLQSPFLTMRRINYFRGALTSCVRRGVRVCVFAQEPEEKYRGTQAYDEKVASLVVAFIYLESIGIHINMRNTKHEKLAVIDERILWDGSLNALSHRDTSERMNRWESRQMVLEAVLKHKLNDCKKCVEPFLKPRDPDESAKRLRALGLDIADRRRLLGLSQKELAKRASMNVCCLSEIEAGHRNVTARSLIGILEELDLELTAIPKFLRYRVDSVLH